METSCCTTCDGLGVVNNAKRVPCEICQMTGFVSYLAGGMKIPGKGKYLSSTPCSACKGYGFMEEIMTDKPQPEMVNHPQHYNKGKYEVIDVIEDWQLSFNLGNTVKYIARHEHKANPVEDLVKAWWYLTREILAIHRYSLDKLAGQLPTIVRYETARDIETDEEEA